MKQADHLAECAREAREQAKLLPRGKLKDALLEKAGEYESEITAEARLISKGRTESHVNR
jgi:hypothetical protein